MADHPLTAEILRDLLPLKPLVMGIYLYGSQAEGTADERSDRDICLVGGEGINHYDLQMTAWRMVRSDIYDIRIFEQLPLYIYRSGYFPRGFCCTVRTGLVWGSISIPGGNDGMIRDSIRLRYQEQ